MFCTTLLFCRCIWGLEPSTNISQYGHTIWRLGQAGLDATPTAIAQTKDGYIWIGTSDGLYRFDGVRFTRWISQGSQRLPNQDIYSLLGASDGSLYIGTGGGLARLRQGHIYIYPGHLLDIRPLIEEKEGAIWMAQRGDEDGFHVLCRVGEKLISCLGTHDGFEVHGRYSIFSDKPGSVWVGNTEGIDHWRNNASPATYPFVHIGSTQTGNAYVASFSILEDGSLWAGVVGAGPGRGLLRFSNGKWNSYVTPQVDGSKLSIRHLLADDGDSLWIGTVSNGLYKLHNGTLDRFDITYGLTGDAVNGIFKDREGNIWVLTDAGIDIFRDLSVLTFTTREGISDESVQAIGVAPDNDVWIGTRHALNIMRNKHISILRPGHGLPTDSVARLYRDSRNTMWITDLAGRLFYYREGRFVAVSTEKDGTNYVAAYGMTEDNKGEIWVTALGPTREMDSLLRVDGTHIAERSTPSNHQIMLAAPHPQEGLWAGGYRHGLFWLHDGQFEPIPLKELDGGVYRLKAESDGSLWIFTTLHNIFRYKNGRIQQLVTQNGLACDSGSNIVDDHVNSHWLYLSCGLVQIRNEELEHWWRILSIEWRQRPSTLLTDSDLDPELSDLPSLCSRPKGRSGLVTGELHKSSIPEIFRSTLFLLLSILSTWSSTTLNFQ